MAEADKFGEREQDLPRGLKNERWDACSGCIVAYYLVKSNRRIGRMCVDNIGLLDMRGFAIT